MPPSGSEAAGGSTRSVSRYAAHAAQAAGRRHLPASVTHKVTLPTEGWSGKCILPPGTARAAKEAARFWWRNYVAKGDIMSHQNRNSATGRIIDAPWRRNYSPPRPEAA